MRRFLFAFVLLAFALQHDVASARVPHHNGSHAASVRRAPGQVARGHRISQRGSGIRATRSARRSVAYASSRRGMSPRRVMDRRVAAYRVPIHGAARRRGLAHVRRLRQIRERSNQRLAELRPEEPTTHALIDPVPLLGFRIPPALKGSHDSLVRQNVRAEADGLLRIEDDDALLALRENKSLVALPVNDGLRVDDRLPANRRYCRPWTARFLSDLGRVHYGRFERPLQVNSAVRTVAFQRTLGHKNGNAAAADGDIASPHLTGATIDIAKKGLSMQEIGWMRAFLLPLQTAGKLDVEEEFQQACFHITVYKSYLPADEDKAGDQDATRRRVARSSTLLATRVR